MTVDERRTSTNGPKNKKTIDKAEEALHPKDDIDRLYVSRKEDGRVLTSIADSVDIAIRRLEDYMKKDEINTDYSNQKQC